MNELIKSFMGKTCAVHCGMGFSDVIGTIEQIVDNWLSIKTERGIELVNIDYVTKISEVPLNKKGKPKAIY